ncbi:aldehyde dehydrogenase family protein [Aquimarina sp. RZ0]|uniref:aldehyde dehydrogenase family protein n=1 Tax=Aquimarina sp. RZ0 TaxID=2607730 RepID=UPI0011F359F5|nr:aldehyde dehydrogenase family protein [Aquimarina sp. RZ0]KAA1244938.1 aldehyde dehydrogenase family protein [Aquimarina sp. RZ0]
MKIRNPRTGLYDYELIEDTSKTIKQKGQDSRMAQKQWSGLGVKKRVAVLRNWMKTLKEFQNEIIDQLSIDTARKKIAAIEMDGIIGLLQGWCYRAPQLLSSPEQRKSATVSTVMVQQQWIPYEVVGVISPWNFPLLLALIDVVPALLAGSSVLLKPSEVTPRFMDGLEKSIQAVPELASVLKLVRGGADAGKSVVENVDAICFTGSVPTGKKIGAVCAERFIPAFLELGGKDPAIVLEDADIDIATDAVLRSAAGATGQACQSLERIYVAETIFDEFVKKITQKAAVVTLTINPEKGQMGPLIFDKQAKKIDDQIDDAIAKGAEVLTGGKVENINGGLWCRPTVLINVTHDMKVMTEETFGPVIPIMSFTTEQEAITLVNDSIYGLSASVFSKDIDNAVNISSQIEAGAISINDGSLTNKVFDAEKNSFKESGINASRMGDAGFLRFFRKKALLIQTEPPATMMGFEENQE